MFKNIALMIMMKNSNKLFGCKITNKKKESYTSKTFLSFLKSRTCTNPKNWEVNSRLK